MERYLITFYRFLLFFIWITITIPVVLADNQTLVGAGATFPYPLYAKWAQEYQQATGIRVNYQPIGSGGGIRQIKAKTVDFGASDLPLSSSELMMSQLMQFPTVMGGVVPVLNLTGFKSDQLKLSGSLLANIYLGKITKWNDPAIIALNPGMQLPNQAIIVVHRSDGSGTTFLFTNYLSKVSEHWQKQVGTNAAVSWPIGIGGKGNEGVAALVQRMKGAIGYVEFAYAEHNQLSYVQLQNKFKHFVSPSIASFQAAAENVDWKTTPDFGAILTNESGENSWPITGTSFILIHTKQDNAAKGKAILQFFDWAYHNGNQMALALNYIPLPPDAIKLIENAWLTKITDNSNHAVWQ